MAPLLTIQDLRVEYPSPRGPVVAVDGLELAIERGETYALVGESGCGKTATALAILRLVEPGRIARGRIVFDGQDLLALEERRMRRLRGARIGMVFQDAGAAFNPVMRVGAHVVEVLRLHRGLRRREAWREAERWLERVALPDPARQARAYPHELSGGMKQRAMIAVALAGGPDLLVADEPTTALDVTVQAEVLELLRRLKRELGLTVLLISHDLGIVAENADRVGVMYAGKLVEEAPVGAFFEGPAHPYARGLLACVPPAGGGEGRRRLPALAGGVPDPVAPPPGCRFHPRCTERFAPCAEHVPPLFPLDRHGARRAACWLHDPARPAQSAPAARPSEPAR